MKLFIQIVCAVFLGIHFSSSYGEGGDESVDRPSARQPILPEGQPRQDSFVLPKIPDSVTESNSLLNQQTLWIHHVSIEGSSVFTHNDWQPMLQAFENRLVSIGDLEELRQQVTKRYIDAGYINSGAIIPVDGYQNGELRMVIVEGKINEVRIKGQERLREGYISNRLLPDPEKPFNLPKLQDHFQTLLTDPLISRMNGRILPGISPGQGILDVDVVRARPYQLSLLGNNQRPPSIGGEAFGLNGIVRNLTGLGDALDFGYFTSAGAERYSGGFNLPIFDWGSSAYFRFDEGDSSVVEQPYHAINIKSLVHSLEGGLSQTILQSSHQHLNLGLALAIRENETSLLQSIPFPFDAPAHSQATVFRFFQDYLFRGEHQAFALRSTLSTGLKALGATSEKYHPNFFSWLGQAQYAHQLFDDGSQWVLRGNAQLSNNPLLPLERIAVGGMYTVRGYRENFLVRDEGFSLSTEYHYPLLNSTVLDIPVRFTLVPFSDFAQAWNYGQDTVRTIASIGTGLDMQVKALHAEIYYGYALKRRELLKTGDMQDNGLHFSVRLDCF